MMQKKMETTIENQMVIEMEPVFPYGFKGLCLVFFSTCVASHTDSSLL